MAGIGRWVQGIGVVALLVAAPSAAQQTEGEDRWWVSAGMGYGSVTLDDNQGGEASHGTFAMSFSGGYAFGPRFRLGLLLGGWLLEASDMWDPAKGESVSHFALLLQGQPMSRLPLVLEAGAGRAAYTNGAPDASNTGGWMWTAGVGYDVHLGRALRLTPSMHFATGCYDSVDLPGSFSADAYSVGEARITAGWSWGARR